MTFRANYTGYGRSELEDGFRIYGAKFIEKVYLFSDGDTLKNILSAAGVTDVKKLHAVTPEIQTILDTAEIRAENFSGTMIELLRLRANINPAVTTGCRCVVIVSRNGNILAAADDDRAEIVGGHRTVLRIESFLHALNLYLSVSFEDKGEEKSGGGSTGPIKELDRANRYLREIDYDAVDEEAIHNWFWKNCRNFPSAGDDISGPSRSAACSSLRSGNLVGRNFDWLYNHESDFLVRTPAANGLHAVMGVSSLNSMFTTDILDNNPDLSSEGFKYIPGHLADGINDAGLYCNANVVPVGDHGVTRGTNPDADVHVCMTEMPYYILSHAGSIDEALDLLSDIDVYGHYQKLADGSDMFLECHFMLAEKENNRTCIVEFIAPDTGSPTYATDNTQMEVIEVSGPAVSSSVEGLCAMTNFIIYDTVFNDESGEHPVTIDYEWMMEIDKYANGTERYNSCIEFLKSSNYSCTSAQMMDFLNESIWYTNVYKTPINFGSEFCGKYKDSSGQDVEVTIDEMSKNFTEWGPTAQAVVARAFEAYADRSRDPGDEFYGTWQTNHSCVYDLDRKTVNIIVQEGASSDDGEEYPEVSFSFKHYYTAAEVDALIPEKTTSRVDSDDPPDVNNPKLMTDVGLHNTMQRHLGDDYSTAPEIKGVKFLQIGGSIDILEQYTSDPDPILVYEGFSGLYDLIAIPLGSTEPSLPSTVSINLNTGDTVAGNIIGTEGWGWGEYGQWLESVSGACVVRIVPRAVLERYTLSGTDWNLVVAVGPRSE